MLRVLTVLLAASLTIACDPDKPDPETDTAEPETDTGEPEVEEVDADGDGFVEDEDCDDSDAAAYPGADEVCDSVDNDCDGDIDEDAVDAQVWYRDADGDGYGRDNDTEVACSAPSGTTDQGGDCNDEWDWIHPGAFEFCIDADYDTDCDPDTKAEGKISWMENDELWDATDVFSGTEEAPAQISITNDVTLFACENTWYANIVIEQSQGLTVIGPYGAESAVFHGGGSDSVFKIEGEGDTGLHLDEVTVTGGSSVSTDNYDNTAGGGIFCRGDGTSTVDIRASTILENSASVGAGVYVDGCSVSISETVITDHTGSYSSGVIIEGGADLFLSQVTLARNTMTGSRGGALEVAESTATLEDVSFSDNTVSDIYINDINGSNDISYADLGSGVWLTCDSSGCE